MLEVKIEELTKSVNRLIEVLTGINEVELTAPESKPEPAPEPKKAVKVEKVVEHTISQSDLEDKFMSIVRADRSKKSELKKILSAYGADNLSELKPENYADAMAKLDAL